MLGPRSLRRVLVALTVSLASSAFVAGVVPSVASAASPHRAAVIVDTGTTVHRVVITFTEDSISGVDALQRAGANPVVYAMGPGAAVCRIYGVGRDPGPDCLGGQDGDNRYWAYFRAPAGTSTYTYSRAGAGSTQVHDGDVEGWKFGTGAAPPYAALPPVTTTTTAPASGPGSTPPGQGPSSTPGGGNGAPGASGTTPTPISAEDLLRIAAAASSTTTTTTVAKGSGSSEKAGTEVAGKRAVRSVKGSVMSDPGNDGGGGSAGSLVIFAVVAVALIGGGLLVRARRRRPVP